MYHPIKNMCVFNKFVILFVYCDITVKLYNLIIRKLLLFTVNSFFVITRKLLARNKKKMAKIFSMNECTLSWELSCPYVYRYINIMNTVVNYRLRRKEMLHTSTHRLSHPTDHVSLFLSLYLYLYLSTVQLLRYRYTSTV